MGITMYWTQPVTHLALNLVCSLNEHVEKDANITGMGDYKQLTNKLLLP